MIVVKCNKSLMRVVFTISLFRNVNITPVSVKVAIKL